MAAKKEDILSVLDAVTRYLSIDLPCQSLTPDAEMGREDLLTKVEMLINKVSSNGTNVEPQQLVSSPETANDEVYDDVVRGAAEEDKQSRFDKRLSSYVDMDIFQPTIDAHLEKGKHTEDKPAFENLEENYEIAEGSNGGQQTMEDSDADDKDDYLEPSPPSNGSGSGGSNEEMNIGEVGELTDTELLDKLKGMENTSPKIVCNGSLCSGYILKQKKKMLSKWNKRYCIVKDCFMFYYKTENDTKSLGVIVLPGYSIQLESRSKFIFKLGPTGKGRSTYLFQLSSESELDRWLKVLSPICSQKLNRLKSDVFNRVARHLDQKAESDEGNAGEPGDEIYDDVLAVQELAEEDEYDDHVGLNISKIVQPVAFASDDLYEGIPGESYEPEPVAAAPIQEDIYEDIPGASLNPTSPIPPPSPQPPSTPAPSLPPRTPVLPPRGAPARPGNEGVPLPPSIPSRRPVPDKPVDLIQEESDDEEPAGPAESDFSYENVYIGTVSCQSNEADELPFNRGDPIYILNKIDDHWWVGCLNDKVGLVQSDVLVPGFAH